MFERYAEKARRVIYVARHETSRLGAWSIETEHLLLGLLSEDAELIRRFLARGDSIETLRRHVEERTSKHDQNVPTSVDLPLSRECSRVLKHAAEEADALSHSQIDTAHLLLGLLREDGCLAFEILREHGLDSSAIRKELYDRDSPMPGVALVPDERTAIRIAKAVWIPLYGQEMIEAQKPYRATLENNIWTVKGSLPQGWRGGVATAKISKTDGTVFKVSLEE